MAGDFSVFGGGEIRRGCWVSGLVGELGVCGDEKCTKFGWLWLN